MNIRFQKNPESIAAFTGYIRVVNMQVKKLPSTMRSKKKYTLPPIGFKKRFSITTVSNTYASLKWKMQ